MEKKIFGLIIWLLIFSSPLLSSREGVFAEEFVKLWLVYVVVITIGMGGLISGLFGKGGAKFCLAAKTISLLVAVFLGVSVITSVLGLNAGYSFWGRPQVWLNSSLSLMIFLLLAYICFWLVKKGLALKYFYLAIIGGGLVLTTWILYRLIQLDGLFNSSGRMLATFRNPNQLGFYLVLVLSCSWGWILTTKNRRLRLLSWLSLGLGLIALIHTNSRASWLSLVMALFLISVLFGKKIVNKKYLLWGIVSLATAIGIFFPRISSRFEFAPENFRESQTIRLKEWQTVAKIYLDHPIWGIGSENLAQIYPRYRDKEMNNLSEEWSWPTTETRNNWLEILVTNGPLGLLAFLALGAELIRRSRASTELVVAGALVVAYYVHTFLYNPNVTVEVFFYVMVGLIAAKSSGEIRFDLGARLGKGLALMGLILGLVALYLLGRVFVGQYYQRQIERLKAGDTWDKQRYVLLADKSFFINPWFDSNLRETIDAHAVLIRSEETDEQTRKKQIDKLAGLLAVLEGRDLEVIDNLSTYAVGKMFYAAFTGGDYSEAIRAAERLVELDPFGPDSWDSLGIVYLDSKNYDKAIAVYFYLINDLAPNYFYSYFHIGETYRQMGMPKKAIPYYEEVWEMGYEGALNEIEEARAEIGRGN